MQSSEVQIHTSFAPSPCPALRSTSSTPVPKQAWARLSTWRQRSSTVATSMTPRLVTGPCVPLLCGCKLMLGAGVLQGLVIAYQMQPSGQACIDGFHPALPALCSCSGMFSLTLRRCHLLPAASRPVVVRRDPVHHAVWALPLRPRPQGLHAPHRAGQGGPAPPTLSACLSPLSVTSYIS